MTALDIIFFLLVGLGLAFGFLRGFVKEVLSLGVWLLVVIAMWLLHGPLSQALVGVIGTVSGAYVLAFALIFLLVFIGGKLIVGRLSGSVKKSRIGPLDRVLGGGFGALKGLVGVSLFYMGFSLIYDTIWGRAERRPDWVARAQTYPVVHAASNTIVDLVEARRSRGRTEEGNESAADEKAADAAQNRPEPRRR